jgi:hypothetical protein
MLKPLPLYHKKRPETFQFSLKKIHSEYFCNNLEGTKNGSLAEWFWCRQ